MFILRCELVNYLECLHVPPTAAHKAVYNLELFEPSTILILLNLRISPRTFQSDIIGDM